MKCISYFLYNIIYFLLTNIVFDFVIGLNERFLLRRLRLLIFRKSFYTLKDVTQQYKRTCTHELILNLCGFSNK